MGTKEYNPLNHSLVQALLKPDACHRYEVPEFAVCLLEGIVKELGRAYINVKGGIFDDRKDWQFTEIPGFEYRRYCWSDCDCGADFPVHDKECPYVRDHSDWNRKRLDALSFPAFTPQQIEEARQRGVDQFNLEMMACRRLISSDEAKEAEWEAANPHPPCTCGAEENWKERDYHLPTCSPSLPNMKFGECVVNWYKHLGRGTSCNVDWTEKQWREWFDAVVLHLRQWEWDNSRLRHGKRPEAVQVPE